MKLLTINTLNEVLMTAIRNKDMDNEELFKLSTLNWPEACEYLELGDSILLMADSETAITLLEAVITDEVQLNREAALDAQNQERDYQMANGWGF